MSAAASPPSRRVMTMHYQRAQGRAEIDLSLMNDTGGFVGFYLLIFLAGSLTLTVTAGCSLTEALFEFASAQGTVRLSIGGTGPQTGNGTLVVEILGMVLGRLEIFSVVTGLYAGVRRCGFRKGEESR